MLSLSRVIPGVISFGDAMKEKVTISLEQSSWKPEDTTSGIQEVTVSLRSRTVRILAYLLASVLGLALSVFLGLLSFVWGWTYGMNFLKAREIKNELANAHKAGAGTV